MEDEMSSTAEPSQALNQLAALKTRLSDAHPEFREALRLEHESEAFCERVRKEIKARRKALGWDQARLAAALGVNQSTISKIEKGPGDLGMKTLYRISVALGLHPTLSLAPPPAAFGAGIETVDPGESLTLSIRTRAWEAAQDVIVRRSTEALNEAIAVALETEAELLALGPDIEAAED
jgi:transcriptional regulator with XRE-family HTH domain